MVACPASPLFTLGPGKRGTMKVQMSRQAQHIMLPYYSKFRHAVNKSKGQKSAKNKSSQCEFYSHHTDTGHMSKLRLKRWHRLENAYTKTFSRFPMRIQVNKSPMCVPMPPPPHRKKHARAIDMGGGKGGGGCAKDCPDVIIYYWPRWRALVMLLKCIVAPPCPGLRNDRLAQRRAPGQTALFLTLLVGPWSCPTVYVVIRVTFFCGKCV